MTKQLSIIPYNRETYLKRDGTKLLGKGLTDGVNVRFYQDRPKKIGGFKALKNRFDTIDAPVIARSLYLTYGTDKTLLYVGTERGIFFFTIDSSLNAGDNQNVTPLHEPSQGSTFVSSPEIVWSFDSINSYASKAEDDVIKPYILAHASPTATVLQITSNDVPGYLYYTPKGEGITFNNVTKTFQSDFLSLKGGFFVLGNYIIGLDANGRVRWNNGESINKWPDANYFDIGSSTFFYGSPVRGANQLSGLAWSQNSVIMISLTYTTDGKPVFLGTPISTLSTCLSSRCIVSAEPVFYWVGEDCFYQYNGAVSVLKNDRNKDFFFDSLNTAQKQKVCGYFNAEYNEVWFLFPRKTVANPNPTENNHAVVYNVDKQDWFDTPLERACAIQGSSGIDAPALMSSSSLIRESADQCYPVWVHDYGLNIDFNLGQNRGIPLQPVVSSFTFWLTPYQAEQPTLNPVILERIILDIRREQTLSLNVNVYGYPEGPVIYQQLFPIEPNDFQLTMQIQGNIFEITVTSNEVDGDYFMGNTMFVYSTVPSNRIAGGGDYIPSEAR